MVERRVFLGSGEERHLPDIMLEVFAVPPPTAASPWVLVCIGTDRCTGDALGPLVGSALAAASPAPLRVYGGLEEPVHAANLAAVLADIRRRHGGAFTVAVDACLGQAANVGSIAVRRGPLYPGTGVRKRLPAVGSAHVVGVVNVAGFMEHHVLQNTRLSLVLRLARAIAASFLALCRSEGVAGPDLLGEPLRTATQGRG